MAGNSKTANRTSADSVRSSKKAKPRASGGGAPAAVSSRGIYSGPTIRGGSGGVTKFSSTEYITDISTPTTTGPPSVTLTINAANATTFPWLSRIAQGFEVYRFTRLRVVYTPSCSSSTNGLVVGGFDFDGNDAAPVNKQQLSALELSGRSNVWNKTQWVMSCPSGWYYNTPTGPVAGDVRLNDTARFFLGVYGAPTAGVLVGELSVSYEVEFAKPEMAPSNLSEFVNIANSSLSNPAGTPTYNGDAVATLSSPSSGTLVFNVTAPGNYMVELIGLASSSAAPPNNCAWASATCTRGPNTIANGASFLDYIVNYVSPGAAYGHLTLFTISVLPGDVITFTALSIISVLTVVRARIAPYKAIG